MSTSDKEKPRECGAFLYERGVLALNLCSDAREYFWLLSSEGSEDLAVELDTSLALRGDEGAVGLVAEIADSGVQTNNPKLTEVSLLVAAVVERVLSGVNERLLREANLRRTAMAIALGAYQYVAAALSRCDSSFYSCHTLMITEIMRSSLRGTGGRYALVPSGCLHVP